MNTDIDESDCIVIQKGGGEVGKRSVEVVGSPDPPTPTPARQARKRGRGRRRAERGGRWLRGGDRRRLVQRVAAHN
jgi:hypothetical protein